MKLATRKVVGISAQRRLQLQAARAGAPTLRERFPHIGTVRIELRFEEPGGITPSPQQHTLYPSARAFFRFACPCAECDGDFDLAPAIAAMLVPAGPQGPGAGRPVSGRLSCEGWRARERANGRPCPTELHYRLSMSAADPH
ncbi:MAG: hypothetical protein IT480_17815 [Gammaproteobacteria bacterium]|nr:hypothetical protein [Gammaproteobacteria bacterium]